MLQLIVNIYYQISFLYSLELYPNLFGIDPLQKAGLYLKSGVWPEDELLRVAEEIAAKKLSGPWEQLKEAAQKL